MSELACDPTTSLGRPETCCPADLRGLARRNCEAAAKLSSREEVRPPWVFTSERHSILEAECRRRIEALAGYHPNAFLEPLQGALTPPADFTHQLRENSAVGRAAIRESPCLAGLRHQIVPTLASDEAFWYCFFEHARAVRASVLPPSNKGEQPGARAEDDFDAWLSAPLAPVPAAALTVRMVR